MAKPKITIIGLGVIGASIGLGLQREPGNFEIVGHDRDADNTARARDRKAIHRTDWNLHNACEGAELIVLNLSLPELEENLPHIREDLRPETLLFAVTNVMQPAVELARKLLPPETHFVAAHPILTGIGAPLTVRTDLFDEVTFGLAAGHQTDPTAVQLASDFVERLGAKPLFVDAQEHDGIIAGVEHLPQLLATILMRSSADSPGWREARRLAPAACQAPGFSIGVSWGASVAAKALPLPPPPMGAPTPLATCGKYFSSTASTRFRRVALSG